jgi:hypothetical protein
MPDRIAPSGAAPAAALPPDTLAHAVPLAGPRRPALLLAVFTVAIFVSAFLLFLVQPMFSKMVLPLMGGTPAVWNTAMLFFQMVLLGGYLYAHLTTRWLGIRRQVGLHLLILAVAFLTLPIGVGAGWSEPPVTWPTLWLLGLLAASLGLPFFILSSSGPLFQRWFSLTGHADAENPYFLYAASNLGSMVALLGYPVLIEPFFRLADQTLLWTWGFAGLFALCAACALLAVRGAAAARIPIAADPRAAFDYGLPVRRQARWVLLAFAASSLLLGVTTYVTTDIAAVPLLWVIPLALYLLTFIIVFARRVWIPHGLAVRLQPFLVIPLAILMFWGTRGGHTWLFGLHLAAFFVTVLVCHGELARDRPPVRHLTHFYLLISVGGALGGAFNTLVAPHLFRSVAEYPLVLVLALLLRPRYDARDSSRARRLDLVMPLALGAVAATIVLTHVREWFEASPAVMLLPSVVLAVAILSANERPVRFGLAMGALLLAGLGVRAALDDTLHRERTFFGTHEVLAREGGARHALYHGTTLHGVQIQDPELRLEPTTYYHRGGPVGQIVDAVRRGRGAVRAGIVGLGTGAIACHGAPGERWIYYEIDPEVVRIARDPALFTFLRDCHPETDVVLGDARITLARTQPGSYDLLVIDAFSSDAIPVHLLTREAVAMYMDRLAPGGVLALHISNRHLRLEPVVAAAAETLGVAARITRQSPAPAEAERFAATSSIWAVLAREPGDLGPLLQEPRWTEPARSPRVPAWTDDYAGILRVFIWQ